jgi:hypothetical protein
MAATPGSVLPTNDDALTVTAISLLSAMLADVIHEGLGHAALALITGTQSGVLTTVAWSSPIDSKLVAAERWPIWRQELDSGSHCVARNEPQFSFVFFS